MSSSRTILLNLTPEEYDLCQTALCDYSRAQERKARDYGISGHHRLRETSSRNSRTAEDFTYALVDASGYGACRSPLHLRFTETAFQVLISALNDHIASRTIEGLTLHDYQQRMYLRQATLCGQIRDQLRAAWGNPKDTPPQKAVAHLRLIQGGKK